MKFRKTPTRLELHRLKYHWSGKKSSLISFSILDEEEKRLLSDAVFNSIYTTGADHYTSYARVFSEWGVACPHPQHKRLYSGHLESLVGLRDHRWYQCQCCGCSCMNEDQDSSLTVKKFYSVK